MEIVYSIFIGIISSKIASKIDGIVLQCRRDRRTNEEVGEQRKANIRKRIALQKERQRWKCENWSVTFVLHTVQRTS